MNRNKNAIFLPKKAEEMLKYLTAGNTAGVTINSQSLSPEDKLYLEGLDKKKYPENVLRRLKQKVLKAFADHTDLILVVVEDLGEEAVAEIEKNALTTYSEYYHVTYVAIKEDHFSPKKTDLPANEKEEQKKLFFIKSREGFENFAKIMTAGFPNSEIISDSDKGQMDKQMRSAVNKSELNLVVVESTDFNSEDCSFYRRLADTADYMTQEIILDVKSGDESSSVDEYPLEFKNEEKVLETPLSYEPPLQKEKGSFFKKWVNSLKDNLKDPPPETKKVMVETEFSEDDVDWGRVINKLEKKKR